MHQYLILMSSLCLKERYDKAIATRPNVAAKYLCLMQTGRAIEIISITMLTYLTLSLSISVFMNWYNTKMAIKEK